MSSMRVLGKSSKLNFNPFKIIKDKPFYMAKYDENGTFIRYEGYCVDLAHRISEILNITYELRGVHDKKFGSMGKSSKAFAFFSGTYLYSNKKNVRFEMSWDNDSQ
jgi:hypothetical protein